MTWNEAVKASHSRDSSNADKSIVALPLPRLPPPHENTEKGSAIATQSRTDSKDSPMARYGESDRRESSRSAERQFDDLDCCGPLRAGRGGYR